MTFRDRFSKLKDVLIQGFAGASVQGIAAPPVLMPVPGFAAIQSSSVLQAAEAKTPSVVDVVRNGRIERTIKPDDQKIIGEAYIPAEFAKELQVEQPPKPEYKDYPPPPEHEYEYKPSPNDPGFHF